MYNKLYYVYNLYVEWTLRIKTIKDSLQDFYNDQREIQLVCNKW